MMTQPSTMRLVWFLMCVFLTLGWVTTARAQDTGLSGLNVELYQPRMDASGYFGVNGPEMQQPGEFYFNFTLGYAHNHIFEVAIDQNSLRSVEDFVYVDLVDNMLTLFLNGSVGINPIMSVGLSVPYHPYLKESDFDTLQSFTSRAMGDLDLLVKLRLLTESENRPALAFLLQASFPTGSEALFTGTNGLVPTAEFLVGKHFKYANLAANVGYSLIEEQEILGVNFNDRFVYGLGLEVPFNFWDQTLSFKGEMRGSFVVTGIHKNTAPIEFTAGFEKDFKNGIYVAAAGGGALTDAIGNPRMRLLLSLGYHFKTGHDREPGSVAPGVGGESTEYIPPESWPALSTLPEISEPSTPAPPAATQTGPTSQTSPTSPSQTSQTAAVPQTVQTPVIPATPPEPAPVTSPPVTPPTPVVDQRAQEIARQEALQAQKAQEQAAKEAQDLAAKEKLKQEKELRQKEAQEKAAQAKAQRQKEREEKARAEATRKAEEKAKRPSYDEGRPGEAYPAGQMSFPGLAAPQPVDQTDPADQQTPQTPPS